MSNHHSFLAFHLIVLSVCLSLLFTLHPTTQKVPPPFARRSLFLSVSVALFSGCHPLRARLLFAVCCFCLLLDSSVIGSLPVCMCPVQTLSLPLSLVVSCRSIFSLAPPNQTVAFIFPIRFSKQTKTPKLIACPIWPSTRFVVCVFCLC